MRKFLLSLVSIMCVATAFALDFTTDGVTYTVNEGTNTVSITDVDTKLTSITLSSTVENGGVTYTVTEIGEEAFKWSAVTTLEIPSTVTSIQRSAFSSCKSLVSVKLPDALTSIPGYAFYSDAALSSINIPDGVTSIGESAFGTCTALQSITFPTKLKSIGTGAFYKAGLKTADLSKGCEELGKTVFLMCPNLTTVKLPSNLKAIGDGAFQECLKLTSITLPSAVESIGAECFLRTPITAMNIPASLAKLGSGAFARTEISKFTIDAANTAFCVVDGVLYDAAKRVLYAYPTRGEDTYEILNGCVGVNGGAFWGSDIIDVTVPETMLAFDDYAFCQSQLTSINFPKSMVYMGEQALASTNLMSVVLPENMLEVQSALLAGCKSLQMLTIPAAVTYIDLRAFWNCTALTEVHCLGSVPPVLEDWYEEDEHPFAYVTNRESVIPLSVPVGYGSTYKNSSWGKIFTNIVEGEAAPFAYVSTTPANEDKMKTLSDIVVTFAEDATVVTKNPKILVKKGDELVGTPIERDAWCIDESNKKAPRIWAADMDGYTDPIALEDGATYTIVIPAGTFKNAAGALNEKIVIEIEGFIPSFDPLETNPATDSELTELSSVDIIFNEAVKSYNAYAKVTLTHNDATVDVDDWMIVNNSSDKKTITVFAADYDGYTSPVKLATGEDYYLTIPAGTFKNANGDANKEIKLHFVGKDPAFKYATVTPKDGSAVQMINGIKFTFAEAATVVRTNPNVVVHKGSLTGEVVEKDLWVVTPSSDKKSINIWPSDYDGYTDAITLDPEVDYYITIPAKTVKNASGAFNEEITLHYVGLKPVFKPTTFSPASGSEMEQFKGVEITFAEEVKTTDTNAAVKMHKSTTGGTVEAVDAWGFSTSTDKKTVTLFPSDYDGYVSPITFADATNYFLIIPANTFKNAAGAGNEEITLKYVGKTAKFEPVSFSPADGTEMKTFSGVDIAFGEAVSYFNNTASVKMHKGSATGTEVDVDSWYVINSSSDKKTPKVFPADYDGYLNPITFEAGVDYYLEIPAKTFKNAAGAWNDVIMIHYKGEPVKFEPVSFSPADGTAMAKFEGVDIAFSEAVSYVNAYASVKMHKGSATGSVEDVDSWYLVNYSSDKKTPRVFPADWDGFLTPITFDKDTDYYLEIPARTFKNAAGAWNDVIMIHYTGEPSSGIEGVEGDAIKVVRSGNIITVYAAEGSQVAIYDMNGQKVESGKVADGNAVFDALASGMYIVKVTNAEQVKAVKVVL